MKLIPKKKLMEETAGNPLDYAVATNTNATTKAEEAIMVAIASETDATNQYMQILDLVERSEDWFKSLVTDEIQDILDEEKKHLAQLSYLVSKFPHIENKWNEGWKEAETGKDTSDESEKKEEEVKESITEDVDQYRDYATAGLKNTLLNILREKYGEQVDEEDEQAIEEFFEPFASERELSPERINLLINEFMSDFGLDEKDKQDIEKEIMLRTVDPNNNTTIENDMENDLTLLRQLENDCSTMVVKNKLSNLINELETDQSSTEG